MDIVIVGAGSAGAAAAARLSEDPGCRVLLLEAGPPDDSAAIRVPAAFPTLFRSSVDWAYRTEPQPELGDLDVFWPRGKTLGGSSSINAMVWSPGFPADYDDWGANWTYDVVEPYFKRVEDMLSLNQLTDPSPITLAYLQACEQAGLTGVQQAVVTQRDGRRWSTADAYLRPAEDRPNLVVRTSAHVTRVLVEHGVAVGVEYLYGGTRKIARAEREVLLCGGAVNTPQLLLLSGIGPADELRALGIEVVCDLPGVGRHLRDHLVGMLLVGSDDEDSLAGAAGRRELVRYHRERRGMLTSNVVEALGFARTNPALKHPDVELIFLPIPFVDEGLRPPDEHGFTLGAVLLRPVSSGQITLRTTDPLDHPCIDPRYLTAPEDRITLEAGMRTCERILGTYPLARRVRATSRAVQTLYHPTGTCRIGDVVDSRLRVRGVDRLRVADASVMPTMVRGHTHGPAVMIGERAADLMNGKLTAS